MTTLYVEGQQIACYTILEKQHVDAGGNQHWLCACNLCGRKDIVLRTFDISAAKKRDAKTCSNECRAYNNASKFIGYEFDRLVVTSINKDHTKKHKTVYVDTVCKCGAKRNAVKLTDLRNKKDRKWACSQVCNSVSENAKYIGYRSGNLVVVGVRHGKINTSDVDSNRVIFLVRCDCGIETECIARNITGAGGAPITKSCGCKGSKAMQATEAGQI